ncbi:MAG: hypothetical protein ACREL3_00985 [Gemmatimonadales bacterium]
MSDWEPQEIVIHKRKPWGRLVMVVLILAMVGVGIWLLRGRMATSLEPPLAGLADHVRSEISGTGDSLDIIVAWQFTDLGRMGLPDSVRVEVGVEGSDARVDLLSGKWRADTLRIAAPVAGTTAMGHSCVSGVHGSRLSRETCTPWQFVRPSADAAPPKGQRVDSSSKKTRRAATTTGSAQVLRIVVRPSGRQVDPDVGGKCAAWQRDNPGRPIWLAVNQSAVAPCMGPNGKPTAAQFCAFAVLEDGSRVKTRNSTNNPYCDELYQAWVRERLS